VRRLGVPYTNGIHYVHVANKKAAEAASIKRYFIVIVIDEKSARGR
jgi:hypothetical protein